MNQNEPILEQSKGTLSPLAVAAIMLFVAVIGPIAAMYMAYEWSTQFQIVASLWAIYYYSDPFFYEYGSNFTFSFTPYIFFSTLPVVFIRYVFVFMMYRYFSGKTTRKRAIITGVASEIQLPALYLILMIPSFLFTPPGGYFFFPLIFPVPVLFVVGYAIIRFRPPPEDETWIDKEVAKQWWDSSAAVSEDAPVESPVSDDPAPQETEDDWLVDTRQ
ncbi:MAG: hypothetical protein ACFFDR_00100 [Candidatus Thorarchaeota archaeon]